MAQPGAQAGGAHVLIVDDDRLVRRTLERALRELGHTAVSVGDGEEGLRQARAGGVDLVLLDLRLPGVQGDEVLALLKADPELVEVRVVMLSGARDTAGMVRCLQLGADDYLAKPVAMEVLKARVEASLARKRLRDQEHRHVAELEAYRCRLEHELRQAGDYVASLLPDPLPEPVRVAWRYLPSTELGGDFLGYQWREDGRLGCFLLDVEGHGVGAALLGVTLGNFIRALLPRDPVALRPGVLVRRLDESFGEERAHHRFATLWYGVYDPRAGRIDYCCAGHPPALLVQPTPGGGRLLLKLGGDDPAVGLMAGHEFVTRSAPVPPGSSLLLYSDGASDVLGADGEPIDPERFAALLVEAPRSPGFLDEQLDRLRAFAGPRVREDDLAMLKLDF